MPRTLKDPIILNLNRSLSMSLSDCEQNYLQKDVFCYVQKLLKKFCTEASDNANLIEFGLQRKNNVIYIQGREVQGKLAF
ncbi:hypothetical protein [Orbus hercynius]|uniref:hypothetical protein n=1 Tax=Orbus hercynius TaxID=593135 RepID=UPI000EB2D19F|nr:hypothetical protein [Orbus hercynius]